MPIDSTNLLVSLAVLQNRGLGRDKVLAASVGAALIPGPLGLVVPLAVANSDFGGNGDGDGTQTLVRVPDVTGSTEADATDQITAKNLTAVSESVFIDDPEAAKGTVIEQDPE